MESPSRSLPPRRMWERAISKRRENTSARPGASPSLQAQHAGSAHRIGRRRQGSVESGHVNRLVRALGHAATGFVFGRDRRVPGARAHAEFQQPCRGLHGIPRVPLARADAHGQLGGGAATRSRSSAGSSGPCATPSFRRKSWMPSSPRRRRATTTRCSRPCCAGST
jgi:hypothetical protein